MWKRIKRIFGYFFSREDEENKNESKQKTKTHFHSKTNNHSFKNIHRKRNDLEIKMKYEYPKTRSFRFPVIPDENKESDLDYSTHLEKDENINSERIETLKPLYQKSDTKDKKINSRQTKTKNKKRFTPTEVPSPIYGFQPRQKLNEVLNVPAYKRRDTAQKEEIYHKSKPIQKDESIVKTETKMTLPTAKPTNKKKTIKNQECRTSKEDDSIDTLYKNINRVKKITKNMEKVPYNVIVSPKDLSRKKDNKKVKQKILQSKSNQENELEKLPLHLLDDFEKNEDSDENWIRKKQELLEKTFQHFNIEAKVINATKGPSVTRFEVQPGFGVKVSRIRNLNDDLKLNLAAKDIRIEAPIPGKNAVGIEIPNEQPRTVRLTEILASDAFQKSKSPLTIALGLDIEGNPVITNIGEMPHGLIAGATGSGKSVCINTILVSLLYKAHYEEVKFLLIDPKMVELASYNGIPHLISPVITDVKAANAALKWVVEEMETRYKKFVSSNVKHIKQFNEKMKKENRKDQSLPYIIVVIDELADLMMVAPQDVEDSICRIAQKARACGIHLIIATQRPSVDVITGLIKANIPTRIAFSVSQQVDSRTIIDTNGAERLLGKGDMLFVENGTSTTHRIQGAFVSEDEIDRITSHVRSLAKPKYLFQQDELLEQAQYTEKTDELLQDVIDFIIDENQASTSAIQRRFRIGYNRAARMMDTLEELGIINQQQGSRPRDILLSREQIKKIMQ